MRPPSVVSVSCVTRKSRAEHQASRQDGGTSASGRCPHGPEPDDCTTCCFPRGRPRHPLLSPYAQTTHVHVAAGAVASVLCYGLGCAVFSLVALMRWLRELPSPAVPAESQQMQPASLTPFAHSVCCRVLHH